MLRAGRSDGTLLPHQGQDKHARIVDRNKLYQSARKERSRRRPNAGVALVLASHNQLWFSPRTTNLSVSKRAPCALAANRTTSRAIVLTQLPVSWNRDAHEAAASPGHVSLMRLARVCSMQSTSRMSESRSAAPPRRQSSLVHGIGLGHSHTRKVAVSCCTC